MPAELSLLTSDAEKRALAVIELLDQAKKEGFDSCVLVGIRGDEFKVVGSAGLSHLKMCGALEFAKWDLIKACT